jgi:hypothetical protein
MVVQWVSDFCRLLLLQAAASVSRVGYPTRVLHAVGLLSKNDGTESGEQGHGSLLLASYLVQSRLLLLNASLELLYGMF